MNPSFRSALIFVAAVSAVSVSHAAGNEARRGGPSCASGAGEQRGDRHKALMVVGLTADQRLICFSENRPRDARGIGTVTGLMSGDTLIGIDFRVQDGMLYGVSKTGGVYRIDTANAAATKVSQLTAALEGAQFGVDFNPAADRLRIVSDTGQNLRHNIGAGGVTIVDGALNYTAGTPTMGVTGAAYTNNDLNAMTATTLFSLDTMLDQVALQSPPNNGTLAATGKLGIDAGSVAGFDIYNRVRASVSVGAEALAVLAAAGEEGALYSVDLLTGKATARGKFSREHQVTDIAIPLNQD
ncbi:MAG: DUF4394 domain-containing protein [Telluria sp.]